MNKDGKAFLLDEETGKVYYKHGGEYPIREAESGDYHPMNLPGIIDRETGKQVFWLDKETFSPITFDSLEVAKFYIECRRETHARELINSLSI